MVLSDLLGLIAGGVGIIGYSVYFLQILRSHSTPNPSSWAIWLLVGIINATTYFLITHGNIFESLIVFVAVCSTLIIFLYALIFARFSKISSIEISIFLGAVAIGIFWLTSNDEVAANLLLQCIYLVSFVPTVTGILRNQSVERATAWIIGLGAYIFSTLSILLSPDASWVALANPIVNGLIGTTAVILAIWYKNKLTNQNKNRAR